METILIYIIIYAVIGNIAAMIMMVKEIENWGLAPGWIMVLFYLLTAMLWPLAVPLILAAIKANKDEEERK